ncbi:MAG: type II toxin-antitoxin system prevent-host-death family antitoxin [Rhodospirillaceae bacterium]|nr:type II toxin-antitoxin system prevent-host-death family antitoxin [Rhodospirillaceae bacterium]
MKRFSANEAKQRFGEMLDAAQRAPVVIERHGRPKAVLISFEDYDESERQKLWALRRDLDQAQAQLDRGEGRPLDPERIKREGRRLAALRKTPVRRV